MTPDFNNLLLFFISLFYINVLALFSAHKYTKHDLVSTKIII